MKSNTLIFLVLITFCACKTESDKQTKPIVIPVTSQELSKPFSNPVLILGSSYGHYFQTLYRNNQFEQMICFTSEKSLKQFGKEKVLDYYKNNFKLDYELGKLSNLKTENGITYLTYTNATIQATRRKIVIPCLHENDSVKIILDYLNANPFE